MNKIAQSIICFLVVVPNTILIYLFVSFILFGTTENTAPTLINYLSAIAIVLIGNITTLQMVMAIKKTRTLGFIYGVIVATTQILGLYVFAITFSIIGLLLSGFAVFLAILLLVRVFKNPVVTDIQTE